MIKNGFFLLIFCFFLGACTEDGALKNRGLELGLQKFKQDLRIEAQNALPDSEVLQQSYIDFLSGKSELQVKSVRKQSADKVIVAVSVLTYSKKMRETLLNVAKKVGSDKTRRFNFGDAVPLVAKESGVSDALDEQPVDAFVFQKRSGDWVSQ